jgi:uncharacterized membrane protein YkoI
MQNRWKRSLIALTAGLACAVAVFAAEEKKEGKNQTVTLADLPAPARATAEKWLAGGTIKKIEKEEEDGKVVYDVEATVKGKHAEADIAADGTVLTMEESVAFDSLPKAVRDAAEKYFGSAKDLNAAKETEKGKASYEVEGSKDNKKVTLKLDDAGKIVEEEKE